MQERRNMNTLGIDRNNEGVIVPKICVPIVGESEEEILAMAEKIKSSDVEIIEWRCDYFIYCKDSEKTKEILRKIRDKVDKIPIIFTLRTDLEGGKVKVETQKYLEIITQVALSKDAQAIDVEFSRGGEIAKEMAEICKENEIMLLLSYHNFEETPAKETLVDLFGRMKDAGADISKIAVMPRKKEDVFTLLEAAAISRTKNPKGALVAISMGEMGRISRICGGESGSVLTFASLEQGSAPGQIEVVKMRKILRILYN